ncbi:ribosome hibernation-promoting factor, HPF/YfiA family [Granulicella sibirica]|uniref:Ribosome-associated protein Y (PSrp-1) n=1 Tax=Granulicella sibirica TaxID=2479048 RepID=A0A4Q0T4R9_9BACT|nr:ribosome-associated translation inhibitor RaiA [Granulicella sibirica]RXH56999.1 Ribosome-associated protein Y (PSrp-1) [Granulicella sibirica]
MNIEYTGRHTTVTAKQKAQAAAGLTRIGEMIGGACSAHVILTVDKYRQMAEISVLCKGQTLVANCEGTDMEAALHDALAKLEQQWVRHNQKTTTMKRHPKGIGMRDTVLEQVDIAV